MSTTAIVFVVCYATGLAMALLRHPLFGLGTYMLVFYVHPPSRWWGESLPDIRWAWLAAIVTAIASLRLPVRTGRPAWYRQAPAVLLVVSSVWVWMQSTWAIAPEDHAYFATLVTKFVVIYYLIYKIVDSESKVETFLLLHVAGCLYLAVLAHSADYSGRLDGVGGPGIDDANSLAMQMATGVMAGSMIILQQRGWKRWLVILAMPLMLDTMIMSGSRSGFLGLAIGSLILWVFRPKHSRKQFYALAGIAVLVFAAVASQQFWERMQTIQTVRDESRMDVSAMSRRVLIKAQLRMASEYPLGTGHRGTAALSPKYLEVRWLAVGENPQRSSHNTFMTALVEQGWPGAVLFVALWIWVYGAARRVHRSARESDQLALQSYLAATLGALSCIFVTGMFVDYVRAEVQIWFLALLSILIGLGRNGRGASTGIDGHLKGRVNSAT